MVKSMNASKKALVVGLMLLLGSGMLAVLAGAAGHRTQDNDNDMASANTIKNGVAVTDSVDPNDDQQDFYVTPILAGQTLKASITFTCATGSIDVSVLDSSGNTLVSSIGGTTYRNCTYLALDNETVYVLVNEWWEPTEYTLTVWVDYPPVITGGTTLSGYVGTTDADRMQYYRVYLAGNVSGKSEAAEVNISWSDRNVDLDLSILDNVLPGRGEVYNYSWFLSQRETISGAASYTGWYTVQVAAFTGASAYTLTCRKFQVDSDGNNDQANLTRAKHNAVITAHVDQGWDHYDWYSYHVLAGDTCRIRVDRLSSGDIFNLSIFDSTMTLIGGAFNFDPQTGPTTNGQVSLPATTSETDYHLYVSAFGAWDATQGTIGDATCMMDYRLTFNSTNHWPQVLTSLDDIAMNEDETRTMEITSRFRDPDQDALAFTASGAPHLNPAYNSTSGNLEIAPAADWFGSETVSVTVSDGFGAQVVLTSNVTVASINDPPQVRKPIANVQMYQGGTDNSIDMNQAFIDADVPFGDKLTHSVSGNGSIWVTFLPNGKVTLYDPVTWYGQAKLTFTATDNASAEASTTCNVTVVHVNQPPHVVKTPDNIVVKEDETATLDLGPVFKDPEDDPITITATGQALIQVLVNAGNNSVTFKPQKDKSGFHEDITFTAQDDKGLGTEFVKVRVTVEAVNDPPKMTLSSPQGEILLTETESQELSVTATDVETPGALEYSWYLDSQDLRISDSTYIYQSNYNSAGSHVIKVVVSDGDLEVSRSWNVTVKNLNRAPQDIKIVSPKTGTTVMQGTMLEFEVTAKDLDGDQLTYAWYDGKKVLSEETSFTTSELDPRTHTIYVEVSDGEATEKSKTISITITPNTKPTVQVSVPVSGQRYLKGSGIPFTAVITDAENDPLTITWSEGSKILGTSATVKVTGLGVGMHTVTLSVYDNWNHVNTTVTFEVYEPPAKSAFDAKTLAILGGVVGLVAVVGALAFIMMRKKKAQPPPGPGQLPGMSGADLAPPPGYDPSLQQVPPDHVSQSEVYYTGSAAPAPAPSESGTYDASQYSAESGISDEQPGVSAQQPSWATSSQAQGEEPSPGGTPLRVEAPPSEPSLTPSETEVAKESPPPEQPPQASSEVPPEEK